MFGWVVTAGLCNSQASPTLVGASPSFSQRVSQASRLWAMSLDVYFIFAPFYFQRFWIGYLFANTGILIIYVCKGAPCDLFTCVEKFLSFRS